MRARLFHNAVASSSNRRKVRKHMRGAPPTRRALRRLHRDIGYTVQNRIRHRPGRDCWQLAPDHVPREKSEGRVGNERPPSWSSMGLLGASFKAKGVILAPPSCRIGYSGARGDQNRKPVGSLLLHDCHIGQLGLILQGYCIHPNQITIRRRSNSSIEIEFRYVLLHQTL